MTLERSIVRKCLAVLDSPVPLLWEERSCSNAFCFQNKAVLPSAGLRKPQHILPVW